MTEQPPTPVPRRSAGALGEDETRWRGDDLPRPDLDLGGMERTGAPPLPARWPNWASGAATSSRSWTRTTRRVELTLAAASLGAANAIINFRLAGDELDYVLNDSGAKVLIVGTELRPLIDKIRDKLTNVQRVIEVTPETAPTATSTRRCWPRRRHRPRRRRRARRRVHGDVPSGTTGRPKGVALTQANVVAHTINGFDGWDIDDGDKNMVAMPLFHVGGSSYVQLGIHTGTPSVMTRTPTVPRWPARSCRAPTAPSWCPRCWPRCSSPARTRSSCSATQDLRLWRLPDAAAAAARRAGSLAEHRLHPGVRAHRGVRRGQSPDARGTPRRGSPRAAGQRRAAGSRRRGPVLDPNASRTCRRGAG